MSFFYISNIVAVSENKTDNSSVQKWYLQSGVLAVCPFAGVGWDGMEWNGIRRCVLTMTMHQKGTACDASSPAFMLNVGQYCDGSPLEYAKHIKTHHNTRVL